MERDQILLEGRGNKFARPSLGCPEINDLRAANAAPAVQTSAVARCRAALVASGVDLDGYTSAEAADDLDDLRRALRIRQFNLIGFSYGTRLAQTVLQRHPEGVRSVVLDSVLPIDVNYDETAASSLRRAIDALLDACATDPACDVRYPSLRARFAALITDADRNGIPAPGRVLRGRDIVEAVGAGLQQPGIVPALPGIISEAAGGRLTGLLPLTRQVASSFNWGLRLSIWCGEEMPFENAARMASQISPTLGLGGTDNRTATPEMCAAWRVSSAGVQANNPVESDVPVHFSGHAGGGLLFDNASATDPGEQLVGYSIVARLLGATDRRPDLVVLNACNTIEGAAEMLQAASAVIATSESVGDASAAIFASHFYAGLGAAQTIGHAVDQARAMIAVALPDEPDLIRVVTVDEIDAYELRLVRPEAQNS